MTTTQAVGLGVAVFFCSLFGAWAGIAAAVKSHEKREQDELKRAAQRWGKS